jgi:predicted Zn-dependent peptidase
VAYGGTSPEHYEQCLDLVRQEIAKVRREGVTRAEMERARNQFRSATIMGQERMSNRMLRMGTSEVYFDRVVPSPRSWPKLTPSRPTTSFASPSACSPPTWPI